MSDKIIFGISTGNGKTPVKGRPAADDFELINAVQTLLVQASNNPDLGDGGLVGAEVSEPHLVQGMNYRSQHIEVHIGTHYFPSVS